jgi:hypothetical protein
MELKSEYRLRVENCIRTIIDVQKAISDEYENQEFLVEFEKLRRTIEGLDMSLVCEGDIHLLEQATNLLLGEFRPIFEAENFGPVYEQQKN